VTPDAIDGEVPPYDAPTFVDGTGPASSAVTRRPHCDDARATPRSVHQRARHQSDGTAHPLTDAAPSNLWDFPPGRLDGTFERSQRKSFGPPWDGALLAWAGAA
jgi:hypothetical protein